MDSQTWFTQYTDHKKIFLYHFMSFQVNVRNELSSALFTGKVTVWTCFYSPFHSDHPWSLIPHFPSVSWVGVAKKLHSVPEQWSCLLWLDQSPVFVHFLGHGGQCGSVYQVQRSYSWTGFCGHNVFYTVPQYFFQHIGIHSLDVYKLSLIHIWRCRRRG